MAHTLLTPTKITREALRILKNQLAFTRGVTRERAEFFKIGGMKAGQTVQVRKPNRYTVRTGLVMDAQDTTEETVSVTLQDPIGVDMNFDSTELKLSIDDFSKRFLVPAMATIANKIDLDGLARYYEINNQVGTPGTTPATALSLLNVNRRLDEEAAPQDGTRMLCVDPAANAGLVDGLKALFNPQGKLSEQFQKGKMGNNVLGFGEIKMDQNIARHTVGAYAGTPLTNGAGQTGASLVTDGWNNSITGLLKKGDVITIAGVNSVNPQSRQSTGVLKQFVVTSDVNSDGSGNATIPISPSIVATGAKQNVTNSAADGKAITVMGTASTEYPINIGHHKSAFVLATVDMEMPDGVWGAREVYDGISMRIVRDFDITNSKHPCRIDVHYGWKCVYQELACRLIG